MLDGRLIVRQLFPFMCVSVVAIVCKCMCVSVSVRSCASARQVDRCACLFVLQRNQTAARRTDERTNERTNERKDWSEEKNWSPLSG